LQSAAAELTAVYCDDSIESSESTAANDVRRARDAPHSAAAVVSHDRYCAVFNPLTDSAVVTCSLRDDIADIYLDLTDGLDDVDAGHVAHAVFKWRLLYYSHWGRHAAHAQTALWQLLADEEFR
jgi:hypothetical protein